MPLGSLPSPNVALALRIQGHKSSIIWNQLKDTREIETLELRPKKWSGSQNPPTIGHSLADFEERGSLRSHHASKATPV